VSPSPRLPPKATSAPPKLRHRVVRIDTNVAIDWAQLGAFVSRLGLTGLAIQSFEVARHWVEFVLAVPREVSDDAFGSYVLASGRTIAAEIKRAKVAHGLARETDEPPKVVAIGVPVERRAWLPSELLEPGFQDRERDVWPGDRDFVEQDEQ
jgi:hypothetical protein